MGSVWRARHTQLMSEVAVKLMSAGISAQPEALQRFLREAQAAARLSSLHVVKVFDYGVDGDTPYIAMELLSGESLRERLDRQRVLAPADALWILRHAARALSRAHAEGIVHRDLKPENLFITQQEEEILKVLDFGVAKLATPASGAPSTSTRTGAVLGTPFYMSPEQARGIRAVDHRSDLWSLGVIAFECLTGTLPFESEAFGDLVLRICTLPAPVPSSVAPVPAGFDAWFARAVEREPDQRFQSADEMLEALSPILCDAPGMPSSGGVAARPVRAEPLAVTDPAPAAARRDHAAHTDGTASQTLMGQIPTRGPSPRTWAFALGAMFVTVAGGAAYRWQRSDAPPAATRVRAAAKVTAAAAPPADPNAGAREAPAGAPSPAGAFLDASAPRESSPEVLPSAAETEAPGAFPAAGGGAAELAPGSGEAEKSTSAARATTPGRIRRAETRAPSRAPAPPAPARPAKPSAADLFSDPD